jgi:hypothetical protein
MTELQLLLLIFTLIYLWECVCWINRGSVAFLTWFGKRWRVAHPASLIGNQSGGFVFAHPLPPLGTILVGNQYPLSVSPDAVLAYVAPCVNPGSRPAQSAKLFKFDDIRKVEAVGKKVRINGELLLKVGSATFASHIAQQVDELTKLPPPKREAALREMLRERFDTKAISERWDTFRKEIPNIRILTNWLFFYLFIFTPILIWRLGFHMVWPALLAGLLCFTIATSIFFRRIHKVFYPNAEDDRFTHFLTILLSPATTIRAHDTLSRPLLEQFHPLAIAKVFCAEDEFRSFASTILRDIHHPAFPVCPRNEPVAVEAENFGRSLLENTAEEFLKKNNVSIKKLLQPPVPTDSTCVSHCPRCLGQFTTLDGKCDDCGGLHLIPFSTVSDNQPSKPTVAEPSR